MDWGTIVLAGLIATAVMTMMMYAGRAMGMQMDMPRMLGLMFAGGGGLVYGLGLMVHLMMGIAFAAVYALLFDAFGINAGWLWGGAFGAAHGVVAGMAMTMMPAVHPRMGNGEVLAAPGPFGVNYGSMVPVGIIMLHIVFGAIVGAMI